MVKGLPILLAGICIGSGIAWAIFAASSPTAPVPVPQAQPLVCDQSDLKRMQERVAQLESELASAKTRAHVTVAPPQVAAAEPQTDESLSWRISAIEKFVPLSDEQKERLREKYTKERAGEGEGAESLEDILGAESAAFYRERVQAAFKKVQDEEVEREVVWLSRTLSLSKEQEGSVRTILANVEAEVSKGGLTLSQVPPPGACAGDDSSEQASVRSSKRAAEAGFNSRAVPGIPPSRSRIISLRC